MIDFLAALGLGFLSFASPCILPLVPAYLANIAGASILTPDHPNRRYILLHTISFIIGFSLIYTALGVIFGLLGAMAPTEVLEKVAGALLIVFGIFLIGATKVPWLNYEKRLNFTIAKGSGYVRSLLIGIIFALGWTSCTGPQLGGVLTMVANSQTVWQKAYLLLGYCVGLGLPFIAVGLAWESASRYLRWLSRHAFVISVVAGVLLISMGILMLTGYLKYLSGLMPGGYQFGQ